MMTLRTGLKSIAFSAFAALSVSSAEAAETLYNCEIPPNQISGFIPTQLVVVVDDATQAAWVLDPYIQTYVGSPIRAEYDPRKNGNFRVKWEVKNVTTSNAGKVRVSWTAFFEPARRKVRVSARVPSYDNSPSKHGTCTIERK